MQLFSPVRDDRIGEGNGSRKRPIDISGRSTSVAYQIYQDVPVESEPVLPGVKLYLESQSSFHSPESGWLKAILVGSEHL